jgi:Domain of unknown function (DUF1707)/Cell wall-active antibiotics response 4TMS YvqF
VNMADNSCMTPGGFNENSRLRASDADRDVAASVINNAMAEGRLTAAEHSDRLDAIYSAKTQAELVPLLDDLPASPGTSALAERARPGPPAVAAGRRRIFAIFGGATRKGSWHVPQEMTALAIFGGIELDFRDAVLPAGEVVVNASAVLGGIGLIVPPDMRVIDDGGISILGGRDVDESGAEAPAPDAPMLKIRGMCLLGGVGVQRKERKSLTPADSKRITGGKGINVSVGQVGRLPAIRIRPTDSDG